MIKGKTFPVTKQICTTLYKNVKVPSDHLNRMAASIHTLGSRKNTCYIPRKKEGMKTPKNKLYENVL